jgi:hypothetical protein
MSDQSITLTKAQAEELLDLMEGLACHCLVGWEDGIDEYFTEEDFNKLKERFVKATQSIGGTKTYEEMASRVS